MCLNGFFFDFLFIMFLNRISLNVFNSFLISLNCFELFFYIFGGLIRVGYVFNVFGIFGMGLFRLLWFCFVVCFGYAFGMVGYVFWYVFLAYVGYVLNMFWFCFCFWYILAMRFACLVMFRACVRACCGHIASICGRVSVTFWASPGHVLGMCLVMGWACVGHVLVKFWYVLDMCWICFGYVFVFSVCCWNVSRMLLVCFGMCFAMWLVWFGMFWYVFGMLLVCWRYVLACVGMFWYVLMCFLYVFICLCYGFKTPSKRF